MNKFFAVILASLALSSVACSPSMSEPPMVPSVEKKAVTAPQSSVNASASTTDSHCQCDNNGEHCILEGAKQVGSGAWDLAGRAATWTKDQAQDPENQKKAADTWDAIKDGAGSLYGKAKDAVSQ